MLIKTLAILCLVFCLVLLYVGFQSPDYVISREVTIQAPPEKIFPFVNTRSLANDWNPWFRLDPDARITTSGPEEGVGSITSWSGGKKIGTGSATVIESIPNEKVSVKLEYQEPFVMSQRAHLLLNGDERQTTVIWRVEGQNNFIGRLICLFVNMDKMMGENLLQGLNLLKTMVESRS